ncbi:hypothetical protein AbraIFM66951_011801 [Aspergillus brasiliensis]|uniref:Uncharacterized protein n=1 Tax=Aspergillus brasiliensis TaxID=319629 RepID=A0A9W5YW81_9EURO|nr:hypothetical protein AbraCBS73388_011963 [Aspergillus brasiliensis]GKZ48051.1 hypothetical protein AbraIFM66951_011801 [Aspergillus brasiliensis]
MRDNPMGICVMRKIVKQPYWTIVRPIAGQGTVELNNAISLNRGSACHEHVNDSCNNNYIISILCMSRMPVMFLRMLIDRINTDTMAGCVAPATKLGPTLTAKRRNIRDPI